MRALFWLGACSAAVFTFACGSTEPKQAGGCPSGTVLREGSCVPFSDNEAEARLNTPSTSTGTSPENTGPKTPYDKEAVETQLKRQSNQVKTNCGHMKDASGKASGPFGQTKVSLTLGRNGRIKEATVPAPYNGTNVGSCIVNAFGNVHFPPYVASSDSIVEWEVEVVEPGKEEKGDAGAKPK
jgi:hypothetical protein